MSVLEQDSRKRMMLGQEGNTLTYLLLFNAVIFVMLNFVRILYLLNQSTDPVFEEQIMSWISLPTDPSKFASRPWTLVLYMFAHLKLLHVFSNLLWLWTFGFILHELAGNKKIFPLYIYGGLAGSIVFILSANLIPELSKDVASIPPLLGAGPALMSIGVAVTALSPRYKIFPMINGGIPLWIVTAIFIVINFATIGVTNWSYALSFAAGGGVGYLFVYQLKRGNDLGAWMSDFVNWLDDLFNPVKKYSKKNSPKKLFYKSDVEPFERIPHITQQRVDELLDKINQMGYHSLSDEEKDFLKKASKEEF